jgi:hypothetical protein
MPPKIIYRRTSEGVTKPLRVRLTATELATIRATQARLSALYGGRWPSVSVALSAILTGRVVL